jgi:predicted nucleotide-binding protein
MTNSELIQSLISDTKALSRRDESALDKLRRRGKMMLDKVCPGKGYGSQFINIPFHPQVVVPGYGPDIDGSWDAGQKKMLNLLETVLEEMKSFGANGPKLEPPSELSNRVFIVHGHDDEMKAEAKLVLLQLGLEPIILHEPPDKNRTIIEKFVDYADVQFAVVLFSGDDYGYSKEEQNMVDKGEMIDPRPRARQNVVLELGFFLGKLDREHVVVIYRESDGIEFPSDISGVLYKSYDKSGSWKFELVKELQDVGYRVSADKLIKK